MYLRTMYIYKIFVKINNFFKISVVTRCVNNVTIGIFLKQNKLKIEEHFS